MGFPYSRNGLTTYLKSSGSVTSSKLANDRETVHPSADGVSIHSYVAQGCCYLKLCILQQMVLALAYCPVCPRLLYLRLCILQQVVRTCSPRRWVTRRWAVPALRASPRPPPTRWRMAGEMRCRTVPAPNNRSGNAAVWRIAGLGHGVLIWPAGSRAVAGRRGFRKWCSVHGIFFAYLLEL